MPVDRTVDDLLSRQRRDHDLIVNFQANTSKQKAARDMTLSDYKARRKLLQDYWTAFQTRDYDLYPFGEKLKSRTYFKENLYESGRSAYLSAESWLSERIDATSLSAPGSRSSDRTAPIFSSSLSALERVKLPKFNGTQREWQSFKSKFQALVLNDQNMTPVIKFQHLLNSLEGEAESKLKGLEVTGENFLTAWETLRNRYDNIFLRFSTHFNALLTLPSSTKETSAHLSSLLNTTNESINAFRSLKLPVEHWDMVFIQCIKSKLAPASRMDWAKQIETIQDGTFPTFDLFKRFLEDRIQTLDKVEAVSQSAANSKVKSFSGQHKNSSGNQTKGRSTAVHATVSNSSRSPSSRSQDSGSCIQCQGSHSLNKCKGFAALSPGKRKQLVVSKGLCTNCFSNRHKIDSCNSPVRCYVCAGFHHTRLHQDGSFGSTTQQLSQSSGEANTHLVISSSHQIFSEFCGTDQLLATAVITLQSAAGVSMTARVLLDSCAEQCIVSEHVVQALNLKRKPVYVVVNGTGGTTNAVAQSRVKLTLKFQRDTNFSLEFTALVLRRVSNLLPRRRVKPREGWSHLDGLQLADPHFGVPSRVDCILSSAVFGATLLPGIRKAVNPLEAPVAQETVFGWVLLGSSGPNDDPEDAASVHHISINHELTEAVARFWETEEIPRVPRLSPSDQQCLEHFRKTSSRNREGRYVVRLPFSGTPQFSGIDSTARACMGRLERRFVKQPDVAAAYSAFMREYIDLGHMEVVPEDETNTRQFYYLPHHPVFKKDSGKIRVVFNGSQKDARGASLNSFLHAGPKLQKDLLVVLLRWCFFRYVFTCDVVKMFRQMLVHPEDLNWQRICWRFSPGSPLLSYSLLTVTYGTASAPFHANACLLDLAEKEADRFPLGSKLLKKNRYVDDFLAGGDTLEETAAAKTELISILSSAGMAVDKWAASHVDFLGAAEPLQHRKLSEIGTVSTLGLKWLPHSDVFNFDVRLSSSPSAVTKRTILSQVATLFDPVGWVSPVVIRAKLLLQCLWLQGADWDAQVTGELKQSWITYLTELMDLEAIRIPRWLGTGRTMEWHLHGFCDASERAFAATIYVVVPSTSSSRFLVAKSKVAPLKVISLPKLELCGASLLTRLITAILPQLEVPPAQIHCWCDSQVVLSWLQSHPSKWKTYVATRVSEITTSLPTATWRHKSGHNPADLATRGCSPRQLQGSEIWWKGPHWLTLSQAEWPSNSKPEATELESRNRVNI
ncbi:uncharacterized protein [Linepithema humile]|uniref:uncharacterized protein n=1 Tax=Linepithema humile TaxID=83485 RepID=UPI00351F5FA8